MQTQIQNYPDISFINNEKLESAMNKAKEWYVERWKSLTGEDIILHDTDEEKILLDAIAYCFYNACQYIDNAGKMNTLKYAMDEFLDEIEDGGPEEYVLFGNIIIRITDAWKEDPEQYGLE